MISIDSPVGQALLQKKIDDEVTIRKPSGDLTVYITAISSSRPL
jgi:transcription elongation factor GreB